MTADTMNQPGFTTWPPAPQFAALNPTGIYDWSPVGGRDAPVTASITQTTTITAHAPPPGERDEPGDAPIDWASDSDDDGGADSDDEDDVPEEGPRPTWDGLPPERRRPTFTMPYGSGRVEMFNDGTVRLSCGTPPEQRAALGAARRALGAECDSWGKQAAFDRKQADEALASYRRLADIADRSAAEHARLVAAFKNLPEG